MSVIVSGGPNVPSARLARAVFALDRMLQRREGVFEYTDDPGCVFRIQWARAEQDVVLSDGTRARLGDPILRVHLWNEQVPTMEPGDSSVQFARRASYALRNSLRLLAEYLNARRDFDCIRVIRADMRLATPSQNRQLTRIAVHCGFEKLGVPEVPPRGFARVGENILGLMLVLAANPAAARLSVLSRQSEVVYMSRALLEERHLRSRLRRIPSRD